MQLKVNSEYLEGFHDIFCWNSDHSLEIEQLQGSFGSFHPSRDHLGSEGQEQKTPLPVCQELWDGLGHQGNKVLQHHQTLHALPPRELPHRRRQQAEGRDEEAKRGQRGRGG